MDPISKEKSTQCPACSCEIKPYWNYCVKCGCALNQKNIQFETINPGDHVINEVAQAESCLHVLRGLISYHERMTMGNYPERDFYLEALRFAARCAEEKIKE